MSASDSGVAVVAPVYDNAATLPALVERVREALAGRRWSLRLVVDGSPDDSLAVARRLASSDGRVRVTALAANVGQHPALVRGLAEEAGAGAWVCIDADLQDPPEAIPLLLDRLATGDVGAVFAGRRGAYEGRARLAGGRLHRVVLAALTGLPADAGAFVALGPEARDVVVRLDPPSVVAAIGVSCVPVTSLPVPRSVRSHGRSSWTAAARVRQSARTLAWTARARVRRSPRRRQVPPAASSQRCTRTPA
ncbi:MAG TPA: glycosyltransferase [Acidimicrobiales bacterium]|nr:glycosyltransferase [Acidimicrobiales bacterium]